MNDATLYTFGGFRGRNMPKFRRLGCRQDGQTAAAIVHGNAIAAVPFMCGREIEDIMSRRVNVDCDELARLHAEGTSVLAMARELGLSRDTVVRHLRRLGLPIRSRSEANRIRATRIGKEGRRALARGAHQARRSLAMRTPSDCPAQVEKAVYSRARIRSVTYSAAQSHERCIVSAAEKAGIPLLGQVAIGPYNADFVAFTNVVVEVHVARYNPLLNPRIAKRTIDLISAGWHVVYLWGSDGIGCDDVVSWAQQVSRDVSGVGQYRVIRGDGEVVAISRDEMNERSLVAAARDVRYILPRPGD